MSTFYPNQEHDQTSILKIASINIGGLNKNLAYLNQLVMQHSIVCVQETWAESKIDLDNSIYVTGKKILFKPAKRKNKVGRAVGGLAFILDDHINTEVKFYGERIGKLTLDDVILLNVYLTFYNGTLLSKEEFTNDIVLLQEVINENKDNKQIVIIGNPIKKNFHSKELSKFLSKNQLLMKDIYTSQQVDHTYSQIFKNGKIVKSWIDHCLAHKDNNEIKNVKILVSDHNLGEHNAISIMYDLKIKSEKTNQKPKKQKKINWLNPTDVALYQNRVNSSVLKLETDLENLKLVNDKDKIKIATTKCSMSSHLFRSTHSKRLKTR
ncbi:unnamed protein product [Brachionus calyciflorus]|uniref:Uncharacterized protein n=1 Tax=Brachionus calyciflorus TaxID=104777 RepID=A0A814ILJ0_9BILA|nr:unnamed protein product [Brachionus calyciflorus]